MGEGSNRARYMEHSPDNVNYQDLEPELLYKPQGDGTEDTNEYYDYHSDVGMPKEWPPSTLSPNTSFDEYPRQLDPSDLGVPETHGMNKQDDVQPADYNLSGAAAFNYSQGGPEEFWTGNQARNSNGTSNCANSKEDDTWFPGAEQKDMADPSPSEAASRLSFGGDLPVGHASGSTHTGATLRPSNRSLQPFDPLNAMDTAEEGPYAGMFAFRSSGPQQNPRWRRRRRPDSRSRSRSTRPPGSGR